MHVEERVVAARQPEQRRAVAVALRERQHGALLACGLTKYERRAASLIRNDMNGGRHRQSTRSSLLRVRCVSSTVAWRSGAAASSSRRTITSEVKQYER